MGGIITLHKRPLARCLVVWLLFYNKPFTLWFLPLLVFFWRRTEPSLLNCILAQILTHVLLKANLISFFMSVFSGAAHLSNFHHPLYLSHLPHLPCAHRLPPPVCHCPTRGPRDPPARTGHHHEPALGRYTHPHLVCLPLHLFYHQV